VARAKGFKYDVALSFAGEQREYVSAVERHLKQAGLEVYYDEGALEEVEQWGKDLVQELDRVYRQESEYCVVFISKEYREKVWTNQELKSALARALKEKKEYLLPARFDDSEVAGLLPTVKYIDLRKYGRPEEFAEVVLRKVRGSTAAPEEGSAAPAFRVPRIARKHFNPYEEARRFIDYLAGGLVERCRALSDRGVSCSRFERGERTCVRVVLNGATRYSLDVWMGGMGGDAGLSFAFGRGERGISGGGMNAWGSIEWGRVKDQPVLKLTNLSFISGRTGDELELTYEKFLDAAWDEVVKALEGDSW
jgi:hypothetical protein